VLYIKRPMIRLRTSPKFDSKQTKTKYIKSKFMLTFWNPMDGNSKVVVTLCGNKVGIRNLHARIAGCRRELNIPTYVTCQ
jgi:hypothetical protein